MSVPVASLSLPQRFDEYSRTVEGIVLRGIEHPACELKRVVILSKGDLADRLDFVKLFQGLANSHTSTECLIVIGADQRERKFFEVENASEFDAARLSPILSKYLSPEPHYEVFTDMRATSGERYVLIVLNPVQPRPIMALVQGETEAKTHFRPGEIWIKHNTGLKTATKADLDRMYEPFIELEAEKRARKRFDYLREELGPALLSQAAESTPTPDLLVGSRERLSRFTEAMISSGDPTRFNMMLEMARSELVEKWGAMLQQSQYRISEEDVSELVDYRRDFFSPVLTSVVEVGLLLIKFDARPAWMKSVGSLLVEAFEVSRNFTRLASMNEHYPETFDYIRPAYDIHVGARTLATYAVMRSRYEFLSPLLTGYVRPARHERYGDQMKPLLFFPIDESIKVPHMGQGRNFAFWDAVVGDTWGHFFGSKEAFLAAAAQLELLLEFNSYLLAVSKEKAAVDFRHKSPLKALSFTPDFWSSRLAPAAPMAEYLYDRLSSSAQYPAELAIEPEVATTVFKSLPQEARVAFLGEVLHGLRTWQGQVAMSRGNFAFEFSWGGRLKEAVDLYQKSVATG